MNEGDVFIWQKILGSVNNYKKFFFLKFKLQDPVFLIKTIST